MGVITISRQCRAKLHPLRGRDTVEVLVALSGSLLHWYGGYYVP